MTSTCRCMELQKILHDPSGQKKISLSSRLRLVLLQGKKFPTFYYITPPRPALLMLRPDGLLCSLETCFSCFS
ncbi:hypothetical protein SRHO_G00277910 [Serrasalmus rhombeus]